MGCQTNEELEEIISQVRPITAKGKVADYIPALLNVDATDISAAIFHLDRSEGQCTFAGNYKQVFTLQSISKVLVLALALQDHGYEYVFNKVGMEPTGDPFNSIIKLETSSHSRPLNPMINAGALAVTSMIKGNNAEEKWGRINQFIGSLLDGKSVTYDQEVARSEFETTDLNRALSYFMKQHQVIETDVEELIDVYTRQCALEMNCLDLARIGAVFAQNGKDPLTGGIIIKDEIARICKTFMVTCGMYNASGEFAIKVGIPAKSGVSGGILGVVQGKYGIGIFSPALDERGNSIAGLEILKILANRYHFSIF
ncbi:glutaminase A [Cytobacillus purgationiresistens]|uniref:Glutaminase n=1 Tax=Cytobacillus purgationiresistens TaxID=863449 RepID=A0ABU0AMD4_9BACI|nr:glutaminase A [Cytobacillus purgationiresistens]MDQ0272416.1 glutaminase [Cytobacillus purgationiresistens]